MAPAELTRLARRVLMVGMPLAYVDETATAHLTAGGRAVILSPQNVLDAAQLRTLTSDVACAANDAVLVAVDQDPGTPGPLAGAIAPLPSTAEIGGMTVDELRSLGAILGAELAGLGINLDLTPDIQVPRIEDEDGADLQQYPFDVAPEAIAERAAAFAAGLAGAGVAAAPGRFPGEGSASSGGAGGPLVVDAGLQELQTTDWPPFLRAIAAGVPAILIGNAVFTAIDPSAPAGLSPATYRLLRREFGFAGLAVSNALESAGAAEERLAPGTIAVTALAAGADLLVNRERTVTEPIVAAIVDAVQVGRLPLERLREAAERVEATAEAVAGVECAVAAGS